jgi:ATP-dependent exoDNAse (exonuclease V) alpha subunit
MCRNVVPKGLFGRGAQFARDILRIERAVELDSRKDPHLNHGYAMASHSSQGQTADRVLIHVDSFADQGPRRLGSPL